LAVLAGAAGLVRVAPVVGSVAGAGAVVRDGCGAVFGVGCGAVDGVGSAVGAVEGAVGAVDGAVGAGDGWVVGSGLPAQATRARARASLASALFT
jgi:hypothetical protein